MKYEKAEVELIRFSNEDVIQTSDCMSASANGQDCHSASAAGADCYTASSKGADCGNPSSQGSHGCPKAQNQ